MICVSPLLMFPPVDWWLSVANAETILLDTHEHFQKMSLRNRYRVPGSVNVITLTVPLDGGRDQHTPMRSLCIQQNDEWKKQHKRTLMSVYGRSPFYEYFADELNALIDTRFSKLVEINTESIRWVADKLNLQLSLSFADAFVKEYPAHVTDIRKRKYTVATNTPPYYQVFGDKVGFVPNMSILDLLFCEGPAARQYVEQHAKKLP